MSQSPTITTPAMMTGAGMILGTAAYMSAGTGAGQDGRTSAADIWAFGCVLYEMLTGKARVRGEDVTDTMAAVLDARTGLGDAAAASAAGDPHAVSALPREGSPAARRGHRDVRCRAGERAVRGAGTRRPRRGRVPPWRRVAGRSAATALAWPRRRRAPALVRHASGPGAASRLASDDHARGAAALTINGIDRDLAITPDGSRIVYVGNNGTQLFVRALDAWSRWRYSRALRADRSSRPTASGSGSWTARRVEESGRDRWAGGHAGAARRRTSRGATWAPDDTMIFATSRGDRPAAGRRRRAGRRRCSRGRIARRGKPITCGRRCCPAAAPCCSRSRR